MFCLLLFYTVFIIHGRSILLGMRTIQLFFNLSIQKEAPVFTKVWDHGIRFKIFLENYLACYKKISEFKL